MDSCYDPSYPYQILPHNGPQDTGGTYATYPTVEGASTSIRAPHLLSTHDESSNTNDHEMSHIHRVSPSDHTAGQADVVVQHVGSPTRTHIPYLAFTTNIFYPRWTLSPHTGHQRRIIAYLKRIQKHIKAIIIFHRSGVQICTAVLTRLIHQARNHHPMCKPPLSIKYMPDLRMSCKRQCGKHLPTASTEVHNVILHRCNVQFTPHQPQGCTMRHHNIIFMDLATHLHHSIWPRLQQTSWSTQTSKQNQTLCSLPIISLLPTTSYLPDYHPQSKGDSVRLGPSVERVFMVIK